MGTVDNYVKALSPEDLAAMQPETYVNPVANTMVQNTIKMLMTPGNVYQSPTPVTTEQMVEPAFDMARALVGGGPMVAEEGAAGALGGKLTTKRPYTFHATDEERQAAIRATDRANKEKTKASLAQLRAGRDSIQEPPITGADTLNEIDRLVNKYQLGTINEAETAKLKNMLMERYQK